MTSVDSVKDNRQFTSSIPFLMKVDSAGNKIWYHYYAGFWDDRSERLDLKILSVADSGIVLGANKTSRGAKAGNPVLVCTYEDGSLKNLSPELYSSFTIKDTTAVSFFSL